MADEQSDNQEKLEHLPLQPTVEQWHDKNWQQANMLCMAEQIKEYFPNFPYSEIADIEEYEKKYLWGVTPHVLSLMEKDKQGNPDPEDPLVNQFFPVRGYKVDKGGEQLSRVMRNWEIPAEMPTPIMQHKYPNKVLIRTSEMCAGYCGFCFIPRKSDERIPDCKDRDHCRQSANYIKEHSEINEIIFSGGDPLFFYNNALEEKLSYFDNIPHVRTRRIHTRALTHNPFKLDKELGQIFKRHKITALGFNIAHPNELSEEALWWLNDFCEDYGYNQMKFAMIPLLKGVNDDADTLEELFMTLYENGVKPYYLLHAMPATPTDKQFRTSVRKGVDLMKSMKRRISNLAMPEYVIVHHTGKHTVPLEPDRTPEFEYGVSDFDVPIIKFKNWKGNWETYYDGRDE